MALFTKLFERDHSPYSLPGHRWRKIHVKSGAIVSHDFKDTPQLNYVTSNTHNYILITSNGVLKVIDYFISPNSQPTTNVNIKGGQMYGDNNTTSLVNRVNFNALRITGSGNYSLGVPLPTELDDFDVYVETIEEKFM